MKLLITILMALVWCGSFSQNDSSRNGSARELYFSMAFNIATPFGRYYELNYGDSPFLSHNSCIAINTELHTAKTGLQFSVRIPVSSYNENDSLKEENRFIYSTGEIGIKPVYYLVGENKCFQGFAGTGIYGGSYFTLYDIRRSVVSANPLQTSNYDVILEQNSVHRDQTKYYLRWSVVSGIKFQFEHLYIMADIEPYFISRRTRHEWYTYYKVDGVNQDYQLWQTFPGEELDKFGVQCGLYIGYKF